MLRTSLAILGLTAFASTAWAAPQLERVRGTVVSATGNSVTVKTRDGATKTVEFGPDTKFVYVAKSSLDNVTDGKFIGTATKGENPPVALEVVIFPASMKGTGEGHYAWDDIHDTTGSSGLTKSSMTNGTIKSESGSMTKSAMTNGTVKSSLTKSSMTNGTVKSGSSAGGGKKIDVTYDNGQSLAITVPSTAPIVEFEPADKSIVKPGAKLFSVDAMDGGKLTAKLVGIGKDGLTPPM